MMKAYGMLTKTLILSIFLFSNLSFSQDENVNPNSIVEGFVNTYLPEFLELGYTESKEGSEESWLVKYDYDSSKRWDLKPIINENVYSFDSSGVAFFAKGSYTFSDDANPNDFSQVGGELKKRWLKVKVLSKTLTKAQNAAVDKCMKSSSDWKTPNQCRRELGFGETDFEMIYFDLDAHLKVEGNRDFGERNYAYGVGIKFSAMPRKNHWVHALNIFEYPGRLLRKGGDPYMLWPIFSIGIEQVDPKDDARRAAVLENTDRYDRIYGEVRHTSPLGSIKNSPVKLSLSYRYFEEIDAPDAIKAAEYDVSQYYTVAFQIPSTVLPNVKTSQSEFIVSYSEGELPFGRTDEKIFEIGWRTNVEFAKMFKP